MLPLNLFVQRPKVMGARRTTFTHWTKSSESRQHSSASSAWSVKALLRGAASADKEARAPRRVDPPMG